MRCACPACGTLMPQAASDTRCVCPDCGYSCAACLGAGSQPLSADAIRALGETLLKEAEERQG